MLGFIRGKVIAKNDDTLQCVVRMARLGFEVSLPRRIYDSVGMGQTIDLWLHTHVREDVFALFGFTTEREKNFFRVLIGISGIGPKAALSLLGEHGAERLIQLILNKDASEISEAPGVGKKLAERLVLELHGKIEKLAWVEAMPVTSKESPAVVLPAARQLREDLLSALSNLGYQPQHIKTTLDRMLDTDGMEEQGFEFCLRSALKEMSVRKVRNTGEPVGG